MSSQTISPHAGPNAAALARIPRFPKVKSWDNVRPVNPEIESEVLNQFAASQRVTLAGFRCSRRDIKQMTPRGLAVLVAYAAGYSVSGIVERLEVPRQDVRRALHWAATIHGLSTKALREIGQQDSPADILKRYARQAEIDRSCLKRIPR